jgi:hypothetical protein
VCSRCVSNVVATLLACCCKAVAMCLPCYCARANWATTHGNNAGLFSPLSFSLRRGFMDYHSICGVLFMEQQSLCPPLQEEAPHVMYGVLSMSCRGFPLLHRSGQLFRKLFDWS